MENHNSRSWNPIVPSFLSTKLFKYLNSPSIFNFSCIEPCSFTVISAFFALVACVLVAFIGIRVDK